MSKPKQNIVEQLERDGDSLSLTVLEKLSQLYTHPMGSSIDNMTAVRLFMEHHVWAVWDFMSLLKSLQHEFAPTVVPWLPPSDCGVARILNEIAAQEEADEHPNGGYISHFELYLEAMEAACANTEAIQFFTLALAEGQSAENALTMLEHPHAGAVERPVAPASALDFTRATLSLCKGPLHHRVAAFTLGREAVIPEMFRNTLNSLDTLPPHDASPASVDYLKYYLERHVELDGDSHGPMCTAFFNRYCANDPATRADSLKTVCRVLDKRLALWDAVEEASRFSRKLKPNPKPLHCLPLN